MLNQNVERTPVKIIAEAGVNHNGSLEIAKRLIDVAYSAGADFVKFQTFRAENLVVKTADKAEYQKKTSNINESQFEMIKKLELSYSAHKELIAHCEQKGIQFLSTAFDLDSIDILSSLDVSFLKIPSGEVTNLPYLRNIGRQKKNVIMSTGMCKLEEVRAAVAVLLKSGLKKNDLTILHCNTQYPTPIEDVNLNAMLSMRDELGVKVGYSDHTLGIEVPIAAVALGATVIEKHFTLDRNLPGPDHAASLEPSELKMMVLSIRNVELAMGSGIKKISTSEKKNIFVARKSIVAKKFIEKGEKFSEFNLTVKRPGNGVCPMKWDTIIGKTSDKEYQVDDLIQ
ncbi:N-acetylneuraminate synthase [Candidatus Poribacteria bacterium]|nr:N-acetylneuraminate synthase [Candidatus Poribacteria bacterium]